MGRKRTALAALVIAAETLTPGAANAQYSDPYAAQQERAYIHRRGEFLKNISYLYFAVGCGVIGSEAGIAPLLSLMRSVLYDAGSPVIDRSLDGMIRAAASDGTAQASGEEGCGYWRSHPEAVFRVRQRATAAAELRYAR